MTMPSTTLASPRLVWICCLLFICSSPDLHQTTVHAFHCHCPSLGLRYPPSLFLPERQRQALYTRITTLRETKEDVTTSSSTSGRWTKANERRAHTTPDPAAVSQQKNRRQNNNNKRNENKNNNNNNNNRGRYKQSPQEQASRQLNQQMIQAETAKDLLLILQKSKGALTAPAGGGKLNNVNFSTSVHRIARHLNQLHYNNNNINNNNQNKGRNNQQNEQRYHRALILSDPRFALLLCGLSEALGDVPYDSDKTQRVAFGVREMANIAWALAKMKIAPPETASPLLTKSNYKTMLLDTSKQLRNKVMQVAKEKQTGGTNNSEAQQQQQAWIPTLSLLCGYILDTIAIRATTDDSTAAASKIPFQERANLLWALATTQRPSEYVFDTIVNRMIDDMEKQLEQYPNGLQQPSPQSTTNSSINNNTSNRNRKHGDGNILQPQEWSNSLWAFATAQIYGTGQERLLRFTADAMETQPGFRDAFKPQEASNTAWAVATLLSKKGTITAQEQDAALQILRQVAVIVTERADEFKTQELSNTVWAFATLGFGMAATSEIDFTDKSGPSSLNDYVVLSSNDPDGDKQLLVKATDAVLASALPMMQRFRSQELNNLAWSLARMDRSDTTVHLEAIGRQLCDPRRRVTPQDIGTTLWSLATLNFLGDDIYRSIAGRLTVDGARLFKPQELSNTLWAMATAEVFPKYPEIFDTVLVPLDQRFKGPLRSIDDPVTLCFGIAAEELMRRPFEFKTQEIKDVLWSFSKSGVRHPELFKATAEHLVGSTESQRQTRSEESRVRGVDDFSPQGLGNMVWAFARQAQLGAESSNKENVATRKSGRMAVYSTCFFDLGEVLVQRLFHTIAEADLQVHNHLKKLKPQDVSNTVWAMAVLGFKHIPFLVAAEQQLLERVNEYMNGKKNSMTTFKGQELANLLWAFAILDHPIHDLQSCVTPFMVQTTVGSMENLQPAAIANVYRRQELANIAWSCAVIGSYPPDLMKLLYCGLIGDGGDQFDASHLNECYRDGGLQQEAVMTLIYLQLALEQEGQDNRLCLPRNFPEGWSQKSSTPGASDFELNLSTSKIQRNVGAAFHRIGFDHVQEHIITAAELLQNQGLPLSSAYQDVISLDIANLQSRIGIEVDGPAHYVADIGTPPTTGGEVQVIRGHVEYRFSMNGERHQINGPTALKKRLLEQIGWRTINIPFWEWYDLGGDEVNEEAYCRSLLQQIGH